MVLSETLYGSFTIPPQHVCSGSKFVWMSLLFLLFIPPHAGSQPLQFEHWSTDNGLSNNWVSAVLQDSRGFLWIATQYGVNKFDGYEFQLYRYDPNDSNSLNSNWVRSMTEDTKGNIWFGLYGGGLARFNPYLEKFTRYQHEQNKDYSLPDNEVYKVCAGHDGRVWVATFRGVAWCRQDGVFHQASLGLAHDLREDGQKTLWLAADDGLFFWDNNRFNAIPVLKGKAVFSIFPSSEAGNKKLWVFTDAGLQLLENQYGEWRLSPARLAGSHHSNRHFFPPVFVDSRHRLWAGAHGGVFMDDEKNAFLPLRPGAPPLLVQNLQSITEDRDGNIWLGTSKGVFVTKESVGKFKPDEFSAALQGVSNLREMLKWKGEFWYAVPNGLFAQVKNKPQKILDVSINNLLLASDGYVFAAPSDLSPPGIFKIHPESKASSFLPFPSKGKDGNPNRKVWGLAEDRKGRIWVGAQGCLYLFDPKTKVFTPFFDAEQGGINDLFIDLKIDRDGHLWAGTLKNGLFLIKNPHLAGSSRLDFKNYRHEEGNPNSLSSNIAETLYAAEDGTIWVGTDGGLNQLNPATGNYHRYLREDGLRDEKIMAITEDAAGRIWVSTAGHGLSCLDTSGVFFHFDKKNGLISNDFLLGAVYRAENGMLYFGSEDGIQAIQPNSVMERKQAKASIYFTAFMAPDKAGKAKALDIFMDSSINFVKKITVPPSRSALTFRFATLGLQQLENVQYAYRLKELNESWHSLGASREFTLTQLPPGKFTLEIKAAGSELFPKEVSKSLQLHIQPAWYQSLPARTMGAFVIFICLIGLYKYRVNRKLAAAETRRLRDLDAIKTRLYTNITHEFRTPLTIILGETEQVKAEIEKLLAPSGEIEKSLAPLGEIHVSKLRGFPFSSLAAIRRNGQQLLNLVNQMLDLAKLESGSLQLNLVQGDVIVFLKYLLESFQSLAAAKGISLNFSSSMDSFTMDYDAERLRQIVSNLLSNAVKFTPEGGEVVLRIDFRNLEDFGNLVLTVSDTGIGIPHEKLPLVFDRFYQADDAATRHAEGTGIGLTLTKELVKLLNGEISLTSEVGKGTTFTVRLPISRNAERVKAMGNDSGPSYVFPSSLAKNTSQTIPHATDFTVNTQQTDQPTLLLIEDNPDVVNYVASILKQEYQVLTASNGRLGIMKALETLPDLILTDVMMPEMDGYEVCRALKNDLNTSHIPIVMLTAKADADSKVEGLEAGASAHLPKPFYEKELLATLKSLRENQDKLRQHYTAGAFIGSSINKTISIGHANRPNAPANQRDEQFLKDLILAVESQLENPELSAERLASLLHVSYNSLFKKVKALTGMGVTEYIRHIRLHRAAHLLLENPEWTVSRISLEVGFNNLNFFSREFKKCLGHSPSAYRSRHEA